MLTSSSTYKTNIKAADRAEVALVLLDFGADVDYPLASSIVASTTKSGYDVDYVIDGIFREGVNTYSGTYVPTELVGPAVGWKGTSTSDAVGTLSVAETITITYTAFDTGNFWVVGTPENYPVDFSVRIHHAGGYATVNVIGNDDYMWSKAVAAYTDVDEVLITITKISAISGENAFILEAGAIRRVCFGMDDIVSMSGTEEISSPGSSIGYVSANDVSITLNNITHMFVMSNTESPFYGLMKPKIRIQPFVGIGVGTDAYELIPLGVFRSLDWNSENDSVYFTISGIDKMDDYNTTPAPKLLPAQNMSLEEYIDSIDTECSLNATIDTVRVSNPSFCYSLTTTLRSLLQEIAEALPGCVYVDRLNVLRIRPFDFSTDSTPVDTWADDDLLITVTNPQQFSTCYSSVKIKKRNIKSTSGQQVSFMEGTIIASGTLTLTNVPFTLPVLYIESVEVRNSQATVVNAIAANPVQYTLELQNDGLSEDNVTIEVTAAVFEENPTELIYDEPVYSAIYEKELLVDNPLLQVDSECSEYATIIFSALADPTSEYTTSVRWDPSVELLDQVILDDVTEKVDGIQIVILRQSWTFDGSLTAEVSGKKTI